MISAKPAGITVMEPSISFALDPAAYIALLHVRNSIPWAIRTRPRLVIIHIVYAIDPGVWMHVFLGRNDKAQGSRFAPRTRDRTAAFRRTARETDHIFMRSLSSLADCRHRPILSVTHVTPVTCACLIRWRRPPYHRIQRRMRHAVSCLWWGIARICEPGLVGHPSTFPSG